LDSNGNRLYFINGQRILIKGGGWTPDLFLRASKTKQLEEMLLVK